MTCNWPIDETCLPALPEESSGDDPEYAAAVLALDAAKALATQVLWALSGRQFCLVTTSVRPCPESPACSRDRTSPPNSYEIFSWRNTAWSSLGCGCSGRCVQSGPGMVHLPGPVHSIVDVFVDGAVLDPSEWAVEGNVLYRMDGWWPSQDMTRPSTEPGTWKVVYLRGFEPPVETAKLAGLLTAEFYQACTGGRCRLPRTVTEVTRQGVSHRVVNPSDIYASGKTGIPEIDLWLSAVNPQRLTTAPVVV